MIATLKSKIANLEKQLLKSDGDFAGDSEKAPKKSKSRCEVSFLSTFACTQHFQQLPDRLTVRACVCMYVCVCLGIYVAWGVVVLMLRLGHSRSHQ